MKFKLFIFGLMAAMAFTSVQAQSVTAVSKNDGKLIDRNSVEFKTIPFSAFSQSKSLTADPVAYWDFDTDEQIAEWSVFDADNDGKNWSIYPTSGINSTQCAASRSYDSGALDPDNWLISPMVSLDGTLSFWAKNYSSTWMDKIDVYVCVGEYNENNPAESFVKVSDGIVPPNAWAEYTFDLADYAGAEGYIAFRHYESPDCFIIYIDNVALMPTVPDAPVDVVVTPEATSAYVTWVDDVCETWNLRYRVVVPSEYENEFWGFEESTDDNNDISLKGGWSTIDADGDGNAWYHLNNTETGSFNNHSGIGHVTSASYAGEALTPDNWLVSPETILDGTLSFWAAGQDASYSEEVFRVYVSTGDPTDPASFEPISEDITATGVVTEYTFDLTSFAGQTGYVAIRHYNVTDMFRLNIDDVAINYSTPAEWITVEGVTSPYTIEGLTPGTEYEVEVQGIDSNGAASEWSDAVVFTTTEDIPPYETPAPDVVIVEGEDAVTITATGEGEVIIYVNYFDGNGPVAVATGEGEATFEIPFGEEDAYVAVWATAQLDADALVGTSESEYVYIPAAEVEPDPVDPHMTGYWAVFTNPEGIEDWVELIKGDNDEYVNTVTLSKGVYGTFNPEDESTRPLVPVYVVINGVRYGAEVDLTPASYGQASANPLFENENFYTLPAGYQYSVGVSIFLDGTYGMYVARGAMTDVDELVAGKTVAGVRYFNAAGQEMSEANGLTIMVTTYTDGTTSVAKVIK